MLIKCLCVMTGNRTYKFESLSFLYNINVNMASSARGCNYHFHSRVKNCQGLYR